MSNTTAHKLPIRKRGRKWQVDARKIGGGQSTYATKQQADRAAQIIWDEHHASALTDFDMTPERRRIAIAAFTKLGDYPDDTLVEAVEFYMEHYKPDTERRTFGEVVDEYLKSAEGAVAPMTLKNDYGPKMRKIKRTFCDREIHAIQTVDLEDWFRDQEISASSRDGWRIRLTTLWQFAVDRGYTPNNAARAIPKLSRQQRKKLRNRPPAIMDAGEIERLLNAAAVHQHGAMLPYFALCALAGLRPYEARRIGWEEIDLARREVHVPAEATKTGDDRDVEMPDALVEWLELVPPFQREGQFGYSRNGFDKIREEAGVRQRWSEPKGKDILRHSAASHHFRLHGNIERTAAAMGHDLVTFKRHYKARVRTKAEAKAYFNVRPAQKQREALQFSKAG